MVKRAIASQAQSLFGTRLVEGRHRSTGKTALARREAPAPVRQLTEAEQKLAAANVRRLQAERAKLRVGDSRDAECECGACGAAKLAFLVEITPGGSQTWETRCMRCRPLLDGSAK